jgi:phosphoenolpyruvate carboxykinase (GTP)
MTETPPEKLTDWQGQEWTPGCGRLAAHPNARFTVSATQCPTLDENWQDPQGVPISAMIFGGRRAERIPLVIKSRNWQEGVYWAATIGSETTSAAVGKVGVVRRDPFAMLPFCGYNMGDYFNHWLSFSERGLKLPAIFMVNWFRKGENGKFLWPGFGQNLRVLDWILRATGNPDLGIEGPLGIQPRYAEFNFAGFDFTREQFQKACFVQAQEWQEELFSHEVFFKSLGARLPKAFTGIFLKLKKAFRVQSLEQELRAQTQTIKEL